jgi:hypothetical protein
MSTPYTEGVAHSARSGGSIVKTLLFFDSMLTPKLITFVYWLALLGAVIGGFGSMFAFRLSFASFMTGIGIMIGGALAARIGCELLIVLFKINEHTHTMANRQ